MKGVINSLPEYEKSLNEEVFLYSVQRIPLKSHSDICEELVTVDMQNLGVFVHRMSGIL